MTLVDSASVMLGVVSSPMNGMYGVAIADDGGVLVQTVNRPTPMSLGGPLVDFDARFGVVVAASPAVARSIDTSGLWQDVGATTGTILSTPLYRRQAGPLAVAVYDSLPDPALRANGFDLSVAGFTSANGSVSLRTPDGGAVQPASNFRVRPDVGGQVGLVLSGATLIHVPSAGSSYQVGAPLPAATGCTLTSSESQTALVACIMPWVSPPRLDAVFWQPDGSVLPPSTPTFVLRSSSGVAEVVATATTGARHAAIIPGAATDSNWSVNDTPVVVRSDNWQLVVFGDGRPTRIIDLGRDVNRPVTVSAGRSQGNPGFFLSYNCTATDGGVCLAGQGSHLAFLSDP